MATCEQLHHWERIRGFWRLTYIVDDFGNLIPQRQGQMAQLFYYLYGRYHFALVS